SSVYPWDEANGLSSLTSARWTPLARKPTWQEARWFLDDIRREELDQAAKQMMIQMEHFYPAFPHLYKVVDYRTAIRAMPRSAADARLIDVVRVGERAIRIRAGKLDAIFHAARTVESMLPEFDRCRRL